MSPGGWNMRRRGKTPNQIFPCDVENVIENENEKFQCRNCPQSHMGPGIFLVSFYSVLFLSVALLPMTNECFIAAQHPHAVVALTCTRAS